MQFHQHILFITDDAELHAFIAEALDSGNVQRDHHLVLIPQRAYAPNLALPDLVLLDYRGAVEAQTLQQRIEGLPNCPLILLGDDEENLEDPARVEIWQQAGAVDYLLRYAVTSHWLRHALRRATSHAAQKPPIISPLMVAPAAPHSPSLTDLHSSTTTYTDQVWQLLDGLFADVPVIVCAFTGPNHVYRYANALYLRVVGDRDVLGKPIREALPELAEQSIFDLLDEVYATGQAYTGQEQQVWLQNHPDRPPEEYTFTLVFAPMAIPFLVPADDEGSAMKVDVEKMIFVIALDVSELVRVRRQWQEAHAQMNALFASSPLGLAFVDRDLRFLRINPALAAMNGLPAEAHIGERPDTLLPELQGIETILAQWRQVIETGEPVIEVEVTGRTPARPDEDQTWEESWFPVKLNDEVLGLGIAAENITQRKEAEAEREQLLAVLAQERRRLDELNHSLERRVQQRSQQVRRLASELTLAEQRERHRIAQILHDHIQQLLYGIDFRIALLTDSASSDQFALLQEFKEVVREAIRATRTLAVDLSPPVLQGEGLVKALQWLIHQMEDIHSLRVTLEAEEQLEVTQLEMRVLLLQSVRELLFNIVKHAATSEAKVMVRQETHEGLPFLVVQVVDHGCGFDIASPSTEPRDAETFGLYSIRERLHLFDGYLNINSAPGDGTRVTLVLPLERGENQSL